MGFPCVFDSHLPLSAQQNDASEPSDYIKVLRVFYIPDSISRPPKQGPVTTTVTVVLSASPGLVNRTLGVKIFENGGFDCESGCGGPDLEMNLDYGSYTGIHKMLMISSETPRFVEFRITARPGKSSGKVYHTAGVVSITETFDNISMWPGPEVPKTIATLPLTIVGEASDGR
jgi:hypothetical protein